MRVRTEHPVQPLLYLLISMVVDEELIVGKVFLINKEPYPDHDPIDSVLMDATTENRRIREKKEPQ